MFCTNIEVKEFHQHPDFVAYQTIDHDIGIIVLKSPFKVGSKVTVNVNYY